LDINWLGHSCFRIKSKEAVIVTDPCNPASGYSLSKLKADIVTSSHNHPGHSYFEALEPGFREISGPGEYELKNIFITGLATYHDNEKGNARGKNTVFLIEVDGLTVCHLGDIGHTPASDLEEELGDIGVLLIPVGGLNTIDSNIATEIVRNLAPKIVIPMHYKTAVVSRDLDPVDKFLKKLGIKEVVSQPKLVINKSTLPLNTQVIVLNYPQ
jgi:L-ascorbate metabolism protein UlaG (beta-lactamase superfamily)